MLVSASKKNTSTVLKVSNGGASRAKVPVVPENANILVSVSARHKKGPGVGALGYLLAGLVVHRTRLRQCAAGFILQLHVGDAIPVALAGLILFAVSLGAGLHRLTEGCAV